MDKGKNITDYIFKEPEVILIYLWKKLSPILPAKLYIIVLFRLRFGYWLDFDNPKTFSEKLQWLKLYNRKPEYVKLVDKYEVKSIVAEIIGVEYIIPTIGVWNSVEEIDFDSLPQQFVLKCTHDSGGLVICKDKSKLDIESAKSKIRKCLKTNYYHVGKEWPYKNVPHRIIAEKYIDSELETNDLPDYKFFCFNGIPQYCQVISGRGVKMCVDFFDKDWGHQPFHEPERYPFAEKTLSKPKHYDMMWNLAEKLAKNKPFSRIDFYDVNGNVYFGEITFFPTSGWGGFNPKSFDEMLGRMITLPDSITASI